VNNCMAGMREITDKYRENETNMARDQWRSTLNNNLQKCCKQCVNLNAVDATGLLHWIHSAAGLHIYFQEISLIFNGKVNVLVTLSLYRFVNISIGMGPNENWWRRKYMSECQHIYICIYITTFIGVICDHTLQINP
jgi:hypothetical protein